MEYFKLFLTFLKIGLFSFGGGYAMIPFIQREIVEKNNWMGYKEFLDIIGISQITPGPIAVNSSTYVGVKTLGIIGAIVATIGVSLGSFILVIFITKKIEKVKETHVLDNIFKGIRPIVIALIVSSAYSIAQSSFTNIKDFVFLIFFIILI